MAVLAPIPKPRIRTAVIVKPGDLNRSRMLYRTDARKPRIVQGKFGNLWASYMPGGGRKR
jgi:hypothetical protein